MNKKNGYEAVPNGIKIGNRIIGYSGAIKQLESGRYDKNLIEGMRLLSYILKGVKHSYLSLSTEKEIILCRWIVVALFIVDLQKKNGTVDVPNDEGGFDRAVIYTGENGSLSVYPGPVRFALANHIEGCGIKKYGVKAGLQLAISMYKRMVEAGQYGLQLSAFGREGMQMLHDGFIEQLNAEGLPKMPVLH